MCTWSSRRLGIPLGNSGLFVTGLSGNVDIFPSYTTIKFGIDMQAAQGGDGGLVKIHGDVTIDTRGLVAFQGKVAVLEGVVGGQGDLWVGWNPLDIGFKVSACFPYADGSQNPCADSWLSGMMRAHLWEGPGLAASLPVAARQCGETRGGRNQRQHQDQARPDLFVVVHRHPAHQRQSWDYARLRPVLHQ